MTTEIQNKVWSCLPKEFKKEVKKEWRKAYFSDTKATLEYFFGKHNLTSDAEEEEMLTVPRKAIIQAYKKCCDKRATKYDVGYADCLYNLFGSKCLPDEGTDCTPVEVGVAENATTSNVDSSHGNVESLEPKPSIPKFKHKLGDKVRIVNDWSCGYKHNGEVTEIVAIDESDPEVPYKVDIYDEEEGGDLWYQESDLEPYAEPILQPFSQVKEAAAYDSNGIDLFEQHFAGTSIAAHGKTDDHIADAGKMVRLNIAAMMAQGLLSNGNGFCIDDKSVDKTPENIAEAALLFADALINEAEKGGNNE